MDSRIYSFALQLVSRGSSCRVNVSDFLFRPPGRALKPEDNTSWPRIACSYTAMVELRWSALDSYQICSVWVVGRDPWIELMDVHHNWCCLKLDSIDILEEIQYITICESVQKKKGTSFLGIPEFPHCEERATPPLGLPPGASTARVATATAEVCSECREPLQMYHLPQKGEAQRGR